MEERYTRIVCLLDWSLWAVALWKGRSTRQTSLFERQAFWAITVKRKARHVVSSRLYHQGERDWAGVTKRPAMRIVFILFSNFVAYSPYGRAMGRHLYISWHFVSVVFNKAMLPLRLIPVLLLVWTSCISWTWKVVCVDKRFVTMRTFFSACRQSRNLFIFTD